MIVLKVKEEDVTLKLYALSISYRFGDHYIGVYPSLEHLHGVIKEMVADMEINISEVPSLKSIKDRLSEKDSFWVDFSDSTWITVQKVSECLVAKIKEEVKKEIENRKPVSKRDNKVRR